MTGKMISENSNASLNHRVIEQMVHGYATQDLDAIMPLFAEEAVYHDIRGGGALGKTIQGKSAIEKHFSFYFKHLMPSHTYEDSIIFAEGNRACASWTLVLGSNLKPAQQYRVRGCDYFLIEDGQVKEKCAFLKLSLSGYLAMARIKLIEFFSAPTTNSNVAQS